MMKIRRRRLPPMSDWITVGFPHDLWFIPPVVLLLSNMGWRLLVLLLWLGGGAVKGCSAVERAAELFVPRD